MKAEANTINIKPLELVKVNVRVAGDTPLIMHAWSEKAKRQMLEKQTKAAKKAKEAKNPVEDFIHSMYWLTEMPNEATEEGFEKAIAEGARFGFPVTAFKQAAISAAYRLGWVKSKVEMRGVFFIGDEQSGLVEIHSDTPIMREDMVMVGGQSRTADIRYRGEFRNWWADLTLVVNMSGEYTVEQIINILNAGGFVCGIGEWRPEKDGSFGQFHVSAR